LACSAVKEKVYNPEKSRIKVVKQGLPAQLALLVCAQCKKPSCMAACPTQSIARDTSTEALVVDTATCIGCARCVDACPLDAIKINQDSGNAIKCDLCSGRPKCVERCNRGAIKFFVGQGHSSLVAERAIKSHLEKTGLSEQQFLISQQKQ
jgi:Fe-S-cluster-containing hydrogenase component 2